LYKKNLASHGKLCAMFPYNLKTGKLQDVPQQDVHSWRMFWVQVK